MCPTCCRPVWSGDHAITERECHHQDGSICRLVRNQNTLIAVLVRTIQQPVPNTAEMRTLLAVIEDIRPSRNVCPRCGSPGVLRQNMVLAHFARADDRRPCGASWARVIAGFEIAR